MIHVRLNPGGVLCIASMKLTMIPGREYHLPRDVVERHAGRFTILATDSTPEPETVVDASPYHVGGGWYEIPGREGKVRRQEAIMLLS